MLKSSKHMLLTVLILFFAWFGAADEGMWMPHQMKELDLKSQGLKMDSGGLYKEDGTGIMNAVVRVRGASGAFVSKEGLILTNHHVVFRAIQRASDKEHDYINEGFLAKAKTEEIPAKGYYIDVLLGYEDVTAAVLKKLKPGMTAEQKYQTLDRIRKKMEAKAEKRGKDLYSSFKSMYSGNKYYLFKFKRLWDVRIVYAPPHALGHYGGEVDNWMWPRHSCDFAFLRAYVSKDNVGVPYSPDHVPYQPKSFLKISLEGVKEGDFTFIMGYPGSTKRHYTSAEFQFDIEEMKQLIETYKKTIDFFEKAGKDNRDIQIKYASLVKGLYNGLKNRIAKLEGFQKHSIPEKKRILETKLMQWLDQHPERKKKYGNILAEIENFMQQNMDFYRKKQRMDALVNSRTGAALLYQAHLITRTVEERQKPDRQREANFQEKDLPGIQTRIEAAERSFHLETDKAYLKFRLKQIKNQDKSRWPKALIPVFAKGTEEINKYVDELYASTILKDPKKRLELVKLKPAGLLKLNDPFIKLAVELERELNLLRQKEKIVGQQRKDLKKLYIAALLEIHQGKIAPDANSSIRFTYGPVKSYHPRDGVTYLALTTLTGVMEKETGTFPFEVPGKLKKLYQARDFGRYIDKNLDDIATCFINTTNVTGGSSGSPVMDANGDIVGISFDMVYESVIGDYFIVPELQRVISVDIRYVMFITEKFSGARYLLEEMGL
ncbi:MAG: S46 family peptidase [Candidatus Aminicenantes bacterium]|nr:MAG: S46 family peptidase [Candidatus Aminicenantes bacterium]